MSNFETNLISRLDEKGNPQTKADCLLLQLACTTGQTQTNKGYLSNHGVGKAIRKKDKTFDYLEMSKLYHSSEW